MNTITKNSRIAIVGGGIGGLALAISLFQKGYNHLKVFEKDQSFQTRRQGYGLTILQGKRALRELGVLEQAKNINAPTKAHYFFNSKGSILGFYGTLFWDTQKGHRSSRWRQKGLSMHVPRQQLRRLLLARLQALTQSQQIMVWNSRLQSIAADQGSVTLGFGDGQKFQADLVVGCDGIYSTVRKLSILNDRQLNFLGVMIVLGICGCQHSLTRQRIFQSSNGQGRFYSMPFIKQLPPYSSMWQFSVPMSLAQIKQFQSDPEMLKSWLLSYCDGWHSPIPELIGQTSSSNIMALQAFDRDPELVQTFDERIILIGDASHPMSPFKSQGANQALLDALSLTSLIQQHNSISIVSSLYRKQQLERTSKKVVASRRRVQKYHSPSYLCSQEYIYPKIDGKLIDLINEAGIDWNGENIQENIISTMKKHNYVA